jgi:hypothetical protein
MVERKKARNMRTSYNLPTRLFPDALSAKGDAAAIT